LNGGGRSVGVGEREGESSAGRGRDVRLSQGGRSVGEEEREGERLGGGGGEGGSVKLGGGESLGIEIAYGYFTVDSPREQATRKERKVYRYLSSVIIAHIHTKQRELANERERKSSPTKRERRPKKTTQPR